MNHEKQGKRTQVGTEVYRTLSTERCVYGGAWDVDFLFYHQFFCHAVSADLGSSAECVWIAVTVDFQEK